MGIEGETRKCATRGGAAAVVAMVLSVASAAGQSVEVGIRGGASVGNYSATLAGLELDPGASLGLSAEAWLRPDLAGYASYRRSSFGCEEGFCADRDVSITSQALVLGGIWKPGLPWVRAGVAVAGLDVDTNGTDESADTGFGIETAVGFEFEAGRVRFRPGASYLRHSASTAEGDGHVAVLALELGVAIAVGAF